MSQTPLSPSQQAAVCYVSSPTIVTAGAGSGKTRTLTSKIAYLVKQLGYDPAKILAITFTNKAASEMKQRLEIATGKPMDQFPWVRTFHSACFRILKDHCELLGYRKPLLIHDDSQQRTHMKKVLGELDLDQKYLYAAIGMVSYAKNSGDPQKYVSQNGKLPRKLEIYRLYNEMLAQNNSVDFDDILLLTRDLLGRFPDIRKQYQEAFDYILIDEFQDSNDIQNQIVDLLVRNGNLTVVGDDYQSIYGFRGADPFHFINFPEKYEGAKIFRLEQNYRSTSQIVTASDALIANNSRRIEKTCFSDRDGERILFRELPDEDAEAKWVAERCWQYVNYKKIPIEQIAILYRTKFTSLPFERALRAAHIPYTMVGAQGFFLRREVQDINSYLICAVNPVDDISFERIINVPRRGIGPGAMNKIFGCRSREMSLQDACRKAIEARIIPKKSAAQIGNLLDFLASISREKPDAAIHRVVEEMNYADYLESFSESGEDLEARLENIKQMIYDASHKRSIPDYLEDAALIRDDQDQSEKKSGMRLSTIHAAKGLEFKVVFVVALEEGILPHQRSYNMDTDLENDRGIEEERRLMYVAMTRASDHLHLTCSSRRRGEMMVPSRFLDEIPGSLLG
ncbi:MAG: ATP-dependent helicase [Syntrophobacteraceae bacterium]